MRGHPSLGSSPLSPSSSSPRRRTIGFRDADAYRSNMILAENEKRRTGRPREPVTETDRLRTERMCEQAERVVRHLHSLREAQLQDQRYERDPYGKSIGILKDNGGELEELLGLPRADPPVENRPVSEVAKEITKAFAKVEDYRKIIGEDSGE